jgi:hypothetical protein
MGDRTPDNVDEHANLKKRWLDLLQSKGWTFKQFAEEYNINPGNLSSWKNNKLESPATLQAVKRFVEENSAAPVAKQLIHEFATASTSSTSSSSTSSLPGAVDSAPISPFKQEESTIDDEGTVEDDPEVQQITQALGSTHLVPKVLLVS